MSLIIIKQVIIIIPIHLHLISLPIPTLIIHLSTKLSSKPIIIDILYLSTTSSMGNSPSQHDSDHPSKLSNSTVLFLKQFSVLSEFPNDRSNADRIISNEATNALKYVNSNFRHTLNGHHKKRKRESYPLQSHLRRNEDIVG